MQKVLSAILVGIVALVSMGYAHAQPVGVTCILQPIDNSIGTQYLNYTADTLKSQHVDFKTVGLIQELTNKSDIGCSNFIQFERQVNSNYVWVDKNAHYTVSGNTLTVYTNTTPIQPVISTESFSQANVMTNWSCFGEALATYHQNLGSTTREACDPYSGVQQYNDKVPSYIVEKAIVSGLKELGL